MQRTMKSTAPVKTAKTAAATTTCWGGVRRPGRIARAGGRRHRPVPRARERHPVGAEEGMGEEGGRGKAGMEMPSTIELLEVIGIGRALARTIRSCKQHGRASDEREEGWEAAAKSGGGTLASLKRAADEEARARSASATMVAAAADATMGVATRLPSLTAKFRARFVHQGKVMYKDPPSPSPPLGSVVVKAKSALPPKQNASMGEFTFAPGDDGGLAGLICDFRPNCPVVLLLLLRTAVFRQRQGHARQRQRRANCWRTRLQRRRAIRRRARGVQSK